MTKTLPLSVLLILFLISKENKAQSNSFPSTGNVGVGTITPASLVHLNSSSPILTLTASQYNGAHKTTLGLHTGAEAFLIFGNNGRNEIRAGNTNPGGYLDFFTNNTVGQETASDGNLTMRLAANGNVGIGTNNAPEKLTIEGGNIKIDRGRGYLLSYASLSETNGGASTILGNNVVAGVAANTVKHNVNPYDNGSFVSLNYYYGITFHTGINSPQNVEVSVHDSEKMRITQNGDVGIGTANPGEKLSVNGKIRAKEIKVEAIGWPDYVFENDYKPKSLPELEAFIKKNKHLPEVPSAKQVEQEGIALGEMNKILLKKIEELTLLLIEQNKKIEQQDILIKKALTKH